MILVSIVIFVISYCFSAAGSITIEIGKMTFLLPPRRAAWIPAGTTHRAIMRGVMAYRSLYFFTNIKFISVASTDC